VNRHPSEPAGSDGASSAGSPAAPIRIGVSTCLLGQPVRFDAGHKRDGVTPSSGADHTLVMRR
jgi:hypothetical protein